MISLFLSSSSLLRTLFDQEFVPCGCARSRKRSVVFDYIIGTRFHLGDKSLSCLPSTLQRCLRALLCLFRSSPPTVPVQSRNRLTLDVSSRAWKTALAVTSNWLFVHQKLGEKVRSIRSWQVIWQHEFQVFAQIGALDGHGGETAGGYLLDDA